MFGIKSKSRLMEESRLYAESVLSLISGMTGSMANPQDQALTEIFGGVCLLYLCRESADFRHIRPYLAKAFLDQTKLYRCQPADMENRIRYINACLAAFEQAEKELSRQKQNPITGLLKCEAASGLADLLQKSPHYASLWRQTVNRAISAGNLSAYKPYAYPEDGVKRIALAGKGQKPIPHQLIATAIFQNETYFCLLNEQTGEKVILRELLRPDGSASYVSPGEKLPDVITEFSKKLNPVTLMFGGPEAKTITLTDENGKETVFQPMDIIPYQGRTFFCLLGKGESKLTILEAGETPGGAGAYTSVDRETAQVIFDLFTERNPGISF